MLVIGKTVTTVLDSFKYEKSYTQNRIAYKKSDVCGHLQEFTTQTGSTWKYPHMKVTQYNSYTLENN